MSGSAEQGGAVPSKDNPNMQTSLPKVANNPLVPAEAEPGTRGDTDNTPPTSSASPRAASAKSAPVSFSDDSADDSADRDRTLSTNTANTATTASTSASSASSSSAKTIADARDRALTMGKSARYSKPQIVLEVISGSTACWIIAITYLTAIMCFSLDAYFTVRGLETHSTAAVDGIVTCDQLMAEGYSLDNTQLNRSPWGCYNGSGNYHEWVGFYPGMVDVLHVNLNFQANNFTTEGVPAYADGSQPDSDDGDEGSGRHLYMSVGARMWACFHQTGCGSDFSTDTATSTEASSGYTQWQPVLFQDTQQFPVVDPNGSSVSEGENDATAVIQFISMFQNQEALPTNSPIKSYYVTLNFTDPHAMDYLVNGNKQASMSLNWLHREVGTLKTVGTALTWLMIVATIAMGTVFVVLVYRYRVMEGKKWLAEQAWFICYLVTVLLYQNPIYLIQNYTVPSAGESLCAYVSSFLSQCALLVVWLLYADAINHHRYSTFRFYGKKVAYGMTMFIAICVVLALQFPSFTIGSTKSPVLSTANWEEIEQDTLVVASVTFISLFLLWAFVWMVRLFKTYRQLNRLPYMSTRYHQLLFRFFFLQATLVTVYYVAQYSMAMYFLAHNHFYGYNAISIADSVNTLIRQQTQLFGKTVFITAYSVILGFILLPPEVLGQGDGTILSTFALDEEEHSILVEQRLAFKKTKSNLKSFKASLTAKSTCVFTISTALDCMHCSNAAYGDSGDLSTPMEVEDRIREELERHNHSLVEVVSDPEMDSQMVVARNNQTKVLVISFRGTQSKKNMSDNLNYRKKFVNFKEMTLEHIDEIDLLGELYVEEEVEEVEEDDSLSEKSTISQKLECLVDPIKTGAEIIGKSAERGILNARKGITNAKDKIANGAVVKDMRRRAKSFAGLDKKVTKYFVDPVSGKRVSHSNLKATMETSTPSFERDPKKPPTAIKNLLTSGGKTIVNGIQGGIKGMKNTVVGSVEGTFEVATAGYHGVKDTVNNVVDITSTLALETIGLSNISDKVGIHRGFLSIYMSLREQMHRIFRHEMRKGMVQVHVAGHSMGGACASLAALDLIVNSMPRVRAHHRKFNPAMSSEDVAKLTSLKIINFGSPRVGDHAFRRVFNKAVPDSFRVVVDGDIVTTVPKSSMGFKHIGTQVLIDRSSVGNIIIDPSFVEKWLRLRKMSSLSISNNPHVLGSYYISLTSVAKATKAMRKLAETSRLSDDFIKSVMQDVEKRTKMEARSSPKSESASGSAQDSALHLQPGEEGEDGDEGEEGEGEDDYYSDEERDEDEDEDGEGTNGGIDGAGTDYEASEEEDEYDGEELVDELEGEDTRSPMHERLLGTPLCERTSLSRASLSGAAAADKDLLSARTSLALSMSMSMSSSSSTKSAPDLSSMDMDTPKQNTQKQRKGRSQKARSTGGHRRVHSMRGSMEFVAHIDSGSFNASAHSARDTAGTAVSASGLSGILSLGGLLGLGGGGSRSHSLPPASGTSATTTTAATTTAATNQNPFQGNTDDGGQGVELSVVDNV